ncbi:MAG: hypothetical protein PXY39_06745 [archaeon]|nr:hypothetical protein [archaeon]
MWTGLIFVKCSTAILEVDKSPSDDDWFFSKGITTLYTSTFRQLEGKPLLGKAGIVTGAGTRIEKSVLLNLRVFQEKPKPKVFAEDTVQCPKCSTIRVIKFGHADNKQVFKCRDCGKKFREISLLRKAHYSPELVTLTLDLYFSGMSLRKVARTVSAQFHIDIHYSTIYVWIEKYISQIPEYVNSLSPQLSDSWHADELFVKMKRGIDHTTSDKRSYEHIAFLCVECNR